MKVKRFTATFLALALAAVTAGCGNAQTTSQPSAGTAPAATAEQTGSPEAAPANADIEIAVIVKGTDSDFWQTVLAGAQLAGSELGVTITTFGPPTEGDLDQQTTIVEDVVNKKPDAIVLASTSAEATVPAVEKAFDNGIGVVLIDGIIQTDKYHSFLATDNSAAGAKAAERLVEVLNAQGQPLSGKVGVISAMAGVSSLTARNDGFAEKLKELAPELEIVGPRYSNGDVLKAVSTVEDMITANSDLIGFFADNNQCGDALAKIVSERGLKDKIACVAFDSDEEEIAALREGTLKGIVLQDPFGMGYKAVQTAYRVIQGESVEKNIDTGAQVATKENMDTPEIAAMLDPSKR